MYFATYWISARQRARHAESEDTETGKTQHASQTEGQPLSVEGVLNKQRPEV